MVSDEIKNFKVYRIGQDDIPVSLERICLSYLSNCHTTFSIISTGLNVDKMISLICIKVILFSKPVHIHPCFMRTLFLSEYTGRGSLVW